MYREQPGNHWPRVATMAVRGAAIWAAGCGADEKVLTIRLDVAVRSEGVGRSSDADRSKDIP